MEFSSSSSFSNASQGKYDVFLNFRGDDTRDNFNNHLYAALNEKKILTFVDNNRVKGAEISISLLKVIEEAKISVVILSKNYAISSWCLEELVMILKCMRNNGQIVIPVFYGVNPSEVNNQEGSFADAFDQREQSSTMNKDKMQRWRDALKEVANLSGWDSLVVRGKTLEEYKNEYHDKKLIKKLRIKNLKNLEHEKKYICFN